MKLNILGEILHFVENCGEDDVETTPMGITTALRQEVAKKRSTPKHRSYHQSSNKYTLLRRRYNAVTKRIMSRKTQTYLTIDEVDDEIERYITETLPAAQPCVLL